VVELAPRRIEIAGTLLQAPGHGDPSLVALARDVLDRQIVDVAGLDVVRVSDLALGLGSGGIRLVGVDVSARTLLRRLGPAAMRRRVAADRLYDWAAVGALSVRNAGETGSVLRLTGASRSLAKLSTRELRVLVDDLRPSERRDLRRSVGESA
jgi:hypothetical protein